MEKSALKRKRKISHAEQFLPDGDTFPAGVFQNSHGYWLRDGKEILHVRANNWILTDLSGRKSVITEADFEAKYWLRNTEPSK